jgi:hypothetical protein
LFGAQTPLRSRRLTCHIPEGSMAVS